MCSRVVRSKGSFPFPPLLFAQLDRGFGPAGSAQGRDHRVRDPAHGLFVARDAAIDFHGDAEGPRRQIVPSQILVGQADRFLDPGADEGLIGELGLHLLFRFAQHVEGQHFDPAARAVGLTEGVKKEVGHGIHLGEAGFRELPCVLGGQGPAHAQRCCRREDGGDRDHRSDKDAVALDKFFHPVRARGRPRSDRAPLEIPLQIVGQSSRGLVTAFRVLLQTAEHDPVEFLPQVSSPAAPIGHRRRGNEGVWGGMRAHPDRGPLRFELPDDSQQFLRRNSRKDLFRKGRTSRDQFVEDRTEAVDIRAGVNFNAGGLLRAHVLGRAHGLAGDRQKGSIGPRSLDRPRDSEVDQFHHRRTLAVPGDEDVGRFQIPVENPSLMGVLRGTDHSEEQFKPVSERKFLLHAEVRQRDSGDQLHHEIGPSVFGLACVENPHDALVTHFGEGPPLRVEAFHHFRGSAPLTDHLEGHFPFDGKRLSRPPDDPHAPLADDFPQLIGSDALQGTSAVLAELPRPSVREEKLLPPMINRKTRGEGAGRTNPCRWGGESAAAIGASCLGHLGKGRERA